MRWGRVSAVVLMTGAISLLSSCGLLGGSGDSATGSDWTVVPLTTSTTTPETTTTRPTASGSESPTASGSESPTPSVSSGLSEQDQRAISVCVAVSEVQAAGMGFWQAYESGDAGLSAAADRVTAAFSRLSEVGDPATTAGLEPVLAEMGRVSAAPDQATMRQVTGEVIGGVGAQLTTVLAGLQPLCPGQLQPDDLDQAERVELAVPPPTD